MVTWSLLPFAVCRKRDAKSLYCKVLLCGPEDKAIIVVFSYFCRQTSMNACLTLHAVTRIASTPREAITALATRDTRP